LIHQFQNLNLRGGEIDIAGCVCKHKSEEVTTEKNFKINIFELINLKFQLVTPFDDSEYRPHTVCICRVR
jgi:hypothetical protein